VYIDAKAKSVMHVQKAMEKSKIAIWLDHICYLLQASVKGILIIPRKGSKNAYIHCEVCDIGLLK